MGRALFDDLNPTDAANACGAVRVSESGKLSAELPSKDSYALVSGEAKPVDAPILDHAPPMPRDRSVAIGLIGAGGISAGHLHADRKYGLNVVAICDRHPDLAAARGEA